MYPMYDWTYDHNNNNKKEIIFPTTREIERMTKERRRKEIKSVELNINLPIGFKDRKERREVENKKIKIIFPITGEITRIRSQGKKEARDQKYGASDKFGSRKYPLYLYIGSWISNCTQ